VLVLVVVLEEGISSTSTSTSTSTTGGIRRPAQLGAEVSKSRTLAQFQDRKASREDKILRVSSTKRESHGGLGAFGTEVSSAGPYIGSLVE
jgi:hypothetical protein